MPITPPAAGADVVLYSLAPAAAAVLGASIALLRRPSATVRSYIQHFAAGVIFAIVAGELLVDLRRIHAVGEIVSGFIAGVVAMLVLRSLTRRLESTAVEVPLSPTSHEAVVSAGQFVEGNDALPIGFLAAVAIDLVVDGLLVGAGFAAGAATGRLLALSLTIELLSLGVAVAVELSRSVASSWRVLLLVVGLAALLTLMALGGATVFRNVSEDLLAVVLSFGVAALLFLVTEELLVEAHSVPETPVSTAMFFAGFLALFVLELVA